MINYNNKQSSHPLAEDREEMLSLWQTTFQDSDEFADMFFSRVYKPENALVIKQDGKIVSALQMIPYEIKNGDEIIPSAYICGVCTLTFERGKGFMKILMNEAIDEMIRKGYAIATLIPAHPWLFDIYKKYGYIYPVNFCIEKYYCDNKSDNSVTGKDHCDNGFSDYNFTTYTNKYFPFFDKKQRERNCAILHNTYDIENILLDLTYNNGNIFVALQENNPVGIAFASPYSEKEIVIKEILYDNILIKEALIYHILSAYKAKVARVRTPTVQESAAYNNPSTQSLSIIRKTYPYGLALILDKHITKIDNLFMSLMLD